MVSVGTVNHIFLNLSSFTFRQPIGPFVMNTDEEIAEAKKDYILERNGFENARSWNSFIVLEDV